MERKTRESKSAATIRRRTERKGILTAFLNWRHTVSVLREEQGQTVSIYKANMISSSDDFLASFKLVRKFLSCQKTLLLGLMTFRILNSLLIQTSFVPDEYWQSVEVAHRLTFGYGYLTWEWQHGLRGYLYPACFAFVFKLLSVLSLDSRTLIVKVPRIMHGICAAVGDLFVYRLSLRLSGPHVARWTLVCQLTSWFLFYTLTRTLTNSMEFILTAIALYYFPWPSAPRHCEWQYITVVAVSIVVRPTAAITWLPLCLWHLCMCRRSLPSLIVQCAVRGLFILLLSAFVDYIFYGKWVNVYYNFLEFNFVSDLGSFYGSHPWHWYFSQGLMVVLSTHVAPLLIAIRYGIELPFLITVFWSIIVYSLLSHKEFRFLMGVLPLIMHICGCVLHRTLDIGTGRSHDNLFTCKDSQRKSSGRPSNSLKSAVLICLVLVNLPIALYMCLVHQRGTIDVMTFLHKETQKPAREEMSILFLMPCHSTPYYSYLHRNVSMRFLTCEPNLSGLANYSDEADVFYSNPGAWLEKNYFSKSVAINMPTHIVMFDELFFRMASLTNSYRTDYDQCARFFHTHFPKGRVSMYIVVMCYSKWMRQPLRHLPPINQNISSDG